MSLHQPTSPHLHVEPLEERFLLSAAALPTPPADHLASVLGQYAMLTAEQSLKDTVLGALNGSASAAPRPAVVYPTLTGAADTLLSRSDLDRDGSLTLREELHLAGLGEAHHAEALALVRSLASHSEPPVGEPIRSPSPMQGTLPPSASELHPLVPVDELPLAHPLTGRADGEPPFPGTAEAEGADRGPPLPLLVALAGGETQEDSESSAVGSSLVASGLVPESGDPLAGLLPLDVQALRRSADAFFARLGNLVRGPVEDLSLRTLAPWLLLSGAAAWELALLPRAMRRSGVAADPFLPGTEDVT